MADVLTDNQSTPSTPAAGKSLLYVDSTTKAFVALDDTGRVKGSLSRNDATASQGAGFATDTFVTNSGILIPSCGMKAGQLYRWWIAGSKTAAGIAQAVYTIRVGPNQSTADTSRLALTAVAQTAVADNGILCVILQVRNVGAAGVLAGCAAWMKTQAGILGLGGSIDGVAASFDNSAVAGQYVGLSINGGASAAWTLTVCSGELIG